MKLTKQPDKPTVFRPIVFVVGGVLFIATMVLNDVPERRRDAPGEKWPPTVISRFLTAPIPMPGMTDLRWYAVPAGLAVMLTLIALRGGRRIGRNGSRSAADDRGSGASPAPIDLRRWWFEGLCVSTVAWAVGSAYANDTLAISRGWILALASGCGWAVLISRSAGPNEARGMVRVASIVLATGAALAMWHRFALGPIFFELPVGPVTITAALGALGASAGLAWLFAEFLFPAKNDHGRGAAQRDAPRSTRRGALVWAALFSLICLLLLAAAARRGAWIALGVALVVTLLTILWARTAARSIRGLILIAAASATIASTVYLQRHVLHPQRSAVESVRVRADYWRHILDALPSRFVFGIGPDTHVFEMTTAMARKRAEQPRYFSGLVDYEAHNEWLQAALELGVPGAAAYLAMPLLVVMFCLRGYVRSARGTDSAWLLAVAAGVAVIVVSESASINLRHPILFTWYWTLLGVGLALIREPSTKLMVADASCRKTPFLRCTAAGGAAMILLVVGFDVHRGMRHVQGRMAMGSDDDRAVELLEAADGRLGVRNWLWQRVDLAGLHSSRLRAHRLKRTAAEAPQDVSPSGARAAELWESLYARCPAYPQAGYRLAETLWLLDEKQRAVEVADDYLGRIHPYDRQVNLLRVQLGGLSPTDTVALLRRAARSSPIDSMIVAIALRELGTSASQEEWAKRVESAMQDSQREDETAWEDPLAPETLRLESVRLAAIGDRERAAGTARTAVLMYERLGQRGSPVRRTHDVEANAWYLAARMRFDAGPEDYQTCFDYIQRAEQAARLEIAADANRAPNLLDLDPVALRNRTPELRQLLRFSGQMHLAIGASDFEVARRANWSLPGDRHTQAQVNAEVVRMAAELFSAFSTMPEAQHPPGMARIARLASQAGL